MVDDDGRIGRRLSKPDARHLLALWMRQASGFDPDLLTPDFTYDSALEKMDRDDYGLVHTYGGTWSSIQEVAIVEGEGGTAVVVEATDDVSLLRHRISWVVRYRGDRVFSIVATLCRTP